MGNDGTTVLMHFYGYFTHHGNGNCSAQGSILCRHLSLHGWRSSEYMAALSSRGSWFATLVWILGSGSLSLSRFLSLSLSWKVPLMKRKIEGWLANQAVRRKQLKICNRFLIVSSSAGALMHSLNGRQGGRRIHSFVKWSLRMLLFGYQWNTFNIMSYTAFVTTL